MHDWDLNPNVTPKLIFFPLQLVFSIRNCTLGSLYRMVHMSDLQIRILKIVRGQNDDGLGWDTTGNR